MKKPYVCAVCNNTGKLDDAQGWDVGEPNSDCPYCLSAVQSLRAFASKVEAEAEAERLKEMWETLKEWAAHHPDEAYLRFKMRELEAKR